MTRTKVALMLLGFIVASALALPAEAWVAYRSSHTYGGYGGAAAWSR
jgi:hypothetical protein